MPPLHLTFNTSFPACGFTDLTATIVWKNPHWRQLWPQYNQCTMVQPLRIGEFNPFSAFILHCLNHFLSYIHFKQHFILKKLKKYILNRRETFFLINHSYRDDVVAWVWTSSSSWRRPLFSLCCWIMATISWINGTIIMNADAA